MSYETEDPHLCEKVIRAATHYQPAEWCEEIVEDPDDEFCVRHDPNYKDDHEIEQAERKRDAARERD